MPKPAPTTDAEALIVMSDGRILCEAKHRPKRGGRRMTDAEVAHFSSQYPEGHLCEECDADDLGLYAIR